MRPGLARIEYRHFIVFEEGGLSAYAAVLTECAGDQGAFWDFHDRFAAADSRLFEWEYALGYAGELGLNVVELRGCMVNRDHLPTVEAMHVGGWELGVRGTPTVFVNGVLVENPSPANVIAAVRAAAGG